MFVLAKKKDERRWQVQIVESVRAGKSVKQKILRNVGVAHTEKELDEFKRIAEAAIISIKVARQPVLPFVNPEEFYAPARIRKPVKDVVAISKLREEKRVNEGIQDVFGNIYKELGLNQLIDGTSKDEQWNEVLEAAVTARIMEPASKRATSEIIREDFDLDIPVQKIYRMLDHLADAEELAKKAVARNTLALFGGEVDVMFFDVTTLYFESIERDELREFGFRAGA